MTDDRIKKMDDAVRGLYDATSRVGTPSINAAVRKVIDTWKEVRVVDGDDAPEDHDENDRR